MYPTSTNEEQGRIIFFPSSATLGTPLVVLIREVSSLLTN